MKVENVIENSFNRNLRYVIILPCQCPAESVCIVVLDTGGRKDLLRRSAVHLGCISVFAEGALMFITTGVKGMRGGKKQNWTINSLSHHHAFVQRKLFELLPLLIVHFEV